MNYTDVLYGGPCDGEEITQAPTSNWYEAHMIVDGELHVYRREYMDLSANPNRLVFVETWQPKNK